MPDRHLGSRSPRDPGRPAMLRPSPARGQGGSRPATASTRPEGSVYRRGAMSSAMQTAVELGPLVESLANGLSRRLWAVVLFGSAARDEATEASDLDLLIVADGLPEAFTARSRLLRSLVPSPMRGRVSVIAKTRDEFQAGFPSYYLDLGLDGIVLHDREQYMQGKIERIRSLIELAGLTRQRVDDGFVWRWREPPAGHWRLDWSGVHG